MALTSVAVVGVVLVIGYMSPKVVPNVCFTMDQRAAEQTLLDAGFQVEWVTGEPGYQLTVASPCRWPGGGIISDESWVIAQQPQGPAPRGTIVRLVWQPPMTSA